jgi:SulP family sulfate permease
MATTTKIAAGVPQVADDVADEPGRPHYDASLASNPDIAVYRISGAFFFGAAATVGSVLDRIADQHRAFVIDFSGVPMIDSTAANAIEVIARKAARGKVLLLISGAAPQIRQLLIAHGVKPPGVTFEDSFDQAIRRATQALK